MKKPIPKKQLYYLVDIEDINNPKWIRLGFDNKDMAQEILDRTNGYFIINKGIEIILNKITKSVPPGRYGIPHIKRNPIPSRLNLSRMVKPKEPLIDRWERDLFFSRAIAKVEKILKNL